MNEQVSEQNNPCLILSYLQIPSLLLLYRTAKLHSTMDSKSSAAKRTAKMNYFAKEISRNLSWHRAEFKEHARMYVMRACSRWKDRETENWNGSEQQDADTPRAGRCTNKGSVDRGRGKRQSKRQENFSAEKLCESVRVGSRRIKALHRLSHGIFLHYISNIVLSLCPGRRS